MKFDCVLNGKAYSGPLPNGAKFIGMEVDDPNHPPRYGKLVHPWFNLPCYITSNEEDNNEVLD